MCNLFYESLLRCHISPTWPTSTFDNFFEEPNQNSLKASQFYFSSLCFYHFYFLGSTGSLNKEPIKEEPTDKPTRPSPPDKQEKAKNNKETSAPTKSETGTGKSKELDLDAVLRSDNKLEHLTSERVKAPKRRPPSSDFRKDAVRIL